VTSEVIYLAMSLRNVGTGIGVLHGWVFYPERLSGDVDRPDAGHFQRLTRDIYVPAGDTGFWMSAFRDPASNEFVRARTAIAARQALTIDLSTVTSRAGSVRSRALRCSRWGRTAG
jgi:hypothetical protein